MSVGPCWYKQAFCSPLFALTPQELRFVECLGLLYCAVLRASGRTHRGILWGWGSSALDPGQQLLLVFFLLHPKCIPLPWPHKGAEEQACHLDTVGGAWPPVPRLLGQGNDLDRASRRPLGCCQCSPGEAWNSMGAFPASHAADFAGRSGADRVVSGAPFLPYLEGLSGFPRAWACSHRCLGPCSQLFSLQADCSANTNTRSRRKAAFAEV